MVTSAAIQPELPELPTPGEILDNRFELLHEIAEGGMGHVFRARDRNLGHEVALKLLIPRYLGRPEREERIRREAELMHRVHAHRNLVQLLDVGRLGDRQWPYLSMTFIEGESLSARLVFGGALPPKMAARIARQIAGALQALHEVGIVHRDVTASNVLMRGDEAVLIDLSHAGDMNAPRIPLGGEGRLTRPHEVPGTHHYMSKEQALAEPAHPSMDIYAFGVTLVHMLTGVAPRGLGREAYIAMQRRGLVESPRVDVLVHPQVPPSLAELANACTEQDAALRPSIDELIASLEEILREINGADAEPPVSLVSGWDEDDAGAVPICRHRSSVRSIVTAAHATDDGMAPLGRPGSAELPTQPLEDELREVPDRASRRYRITIVTLLILLLVTVGTALWLWSRLNGERARASADPLASVGPSAREHLDVPAPPTSAAERFDAAQDESFDGTVNTDGSGGVSASVEHPDVEASSTIVRGAAELDAPEPTVTKPEAIPPRSTSRSKRRARPRPAAEPAASPREEPTSPPCTDPTPSVQRALGSRSWNKVLALTATGRCWGSDDIRWSSRAMALYRLGRYAQCLNAARRSTGVNSKRMAAMCAKSIDSQSSTP